MSASVTTSRLALATALAGAAALGYETLWTRLLGLVLGHELLGVLSVLAGFFGGMGIGAWLVSDRADRLVRPARTFAILQVAAAAYALAAPWLLHGLASVLPALLGLEPSLLGPIAIATVVLLPATICIGAGLPVLVAARRRIASDDARGLARLYALDTLGATLGVGLTIHLFLPRLGFVWGSLVLAALGLAAAGLALQAGESTDVDQGHAPSDHPALAATGDPDGGLLHERRLLFLVFAATGLLGLALEVVGVRVLAQVYSGTIFSFADLLAVWLLGTALGNALHGHMSASLLGRRPATALVLGLLAMAVVVAFAAASASMAPALLERWAPADAGHVQRQLAEVGVALVVLGPATVPMGMLFAHLLALLAAPAAGDPDRRPRPVGTALALNGACAAAAPFVVAIGLFGRFTYAETWASIAWSYLVLALVVGWARRFAPRRLALIAVLGVVGVGTGSGLAGSLVLAPEQDEGWTLVEEREGALGVVRVSETTRPPGTPEHPLRRLWVDRHFRMGGALAIGDRRMGQIPLLLAGDLQGQRVLYLGLGTGATAGSALAHPVEDVTAVELIPEVVAVLDRFDHVNAGLAHDPRARIVVADARRFLVSERGSYRVIVADLFHPARDGAASLYAREHFEAARARLDERGIFVQWLPLHQLEPEALALILRTFLVVFPEAHAWLGLYNVETPALALIGARTPVVVDFVDMDARMHEGELGRILAELALDDPRDLLAAHLLDRAGLSAFAGSGPIHEDMRPRLDFLAAKRPATPTTGWHNVRALLAVRRSWPDDLIDATPSLRAELRQSSASFGDALALYLRGEGSRLEATLAWGSTPPWSRSLVAPYLEAYEREPEFVPVRPWLYAAATADPELAEWILPTMLVRTPEEPRVHRAWLSHLARSGDTTRFGLALADARARFGEAFDPGTRPVQSPQ